MKIYTQTNKVTTNLFGLMLNLVKPLVKLIFWSSCEVGGGKKSRNDF